MFTVETSEIEKEKTLEVKLQLASKNIAIIAKITPLEDVDTGKKSKHVRYFKAKVLEKLRSGEVDQTIEVSLNEKSIVFTDKSTSFIDIADFEEELHITEKSTKELTK